MTTDPHADQPVATRGPAPEAADAAVVMLHGRGATAHGILELSREFPGTGSVTYYAPQAANNTWYPQSFLAPIESNEPALSSALSFVDRVLGTLTDAGLDYDRIVLLGFSQGACLASEYAVRNARRYGGLVAFSGGVIGPDGTPREYEGSLSGTPAFLGCSDRDPHIPVERVHETTAVLDDLGADVTEKIYEGMGHTVNEDEIATAAGMIGALVGE